MNKEIVFYIRKNLGPWRKEERGVNRLKSPMCLLLLPTWGSPPPPESQAMRKSLQHPTLPLSPEPADWAGDAAGVGPLPGGSWPG